MWGLWSAAPSQTDAFSTWTQDELVWCGTAQVWEPATPNDTADSLVASWKLNAPNAGTQILWGCPVDSLWEVPAVGDPGNFEGWAAEVRWVQEVSGSASNRSSLYWAAPPADDPQESAFLLASSMQAGWLDGTGGLSAGQTGSEDPLECHAPNLASWIVPPSCHAWSDPFALNATWSWSANGRWKVQARDEALRSATWIDTVAGPPLTRMPCVGIEVNHTSSQGDRWTFGWRPTVSGSMTNPTDPFEPSVPAPLTRLVLVDSLQVEGTAWPPPDTPTAVEFRLTCDPEPFPTVSPHATETTCENVWRWNLPCPVSPGSSVLAKMDSTSTVLWRDGTSLLEWGDLAFTEILADPTPAIHAPESSYLEVMNVSELALDPQQLHLEDSGDLHPLVWVRRPEHGLIPPGIRFVIADASAPWLDTTLNSIDLWVLKATGWSGLRDEGERVALHGPGGLIEDLQFYATWWQDIPQDGVSLSCTSPAACDHPENWMPDPEGASPGTASVLESAPSLSPFPYLNIKRTPNGLVEWDASPAWHPENPPNIAAKHATTTDTLVPWFSWDNGEPAWMSAWHEAWEGPVRLLVHPGTLCTPTLTWVHWDMMWGAYRPPLSGDVVLTEILASTHPVAQAEFAEWTNVSIDTLEWHGRPWPPQTCLVQSSMPRERFLSWMGSAWWRDSTKVIWETIPALRFSNAAGTATLTDAWGNLIASEEYSVCSHSSSRAESEGRSLEKLPTEVKFGQSGLAPGPEMWRSAPLPLGMSPGTVTGTPAGWNDHPDGDGDESDIPLDGPSLPLAWGVWDGKWAVKVPAGGDLGRLRAQDWNPQTRWVPRWHRGVLLAVADWGPDSLPRGPRHIFDDSWSFPAASWDQGPQPSELPVWNEVLTESSEGFGSFVEWRGASTGSWMRDWIWSSDPWATAGDFVPVSEVTWWVAEAEETCLATCPRWVESAAGRCLPADVPSLHGDRVLNLRTPEGEALLDLSLLAHSPWVTDRKGRSLINLAGTDVWTSSPAHMRASPGLPNNADVGVTSAVNGNLTCSPRTLQPGGATGSDVVQITWTPPTVGDVYETEYGIVNPRGWSPMNENQSFWAGEPFQWMWHGEDDQGGVLPPGTYVAVFAWRNLTKGGKGVDRCLVALAAH
ncbi:MAG: hypothetical protein ACPG9S_00725 [Flavobacteriales bacterium]